MCPAKEVECVDCCESKSESKSEGEGVRKRIEMVEYFFRLNTYQVISNACIDNIVKYTLSHSLCELICLNIFGT